MALKTNYKELEFYKRGKQFCTIIFKTIEKFPKSEQFGLTNQIRRASVSIITNIAEGTGRSTTKDFKHFLHMSVGSAKEVEALIELSKELNYINFSEHKDLTNEMNGIIGPLLNYIKRMDNGFMEGLN